MTTTSTIFIPQDDFRRLSALAAALPRNGNHDGGPTLRGELERATVLPREHLPPGVVTVNSRVRFRDVDSDVADEYILTWPEHADGGIARISVLAPIGTALLGYRVGDEISWPTPGGTRRLLVVEAESVPEESFVDPKEAVLARLLSGAR